MSAPTVAPSAASARPERWHLLPAVYLASLAILLTGILVSPWPYSDPRFVVEYAWTEAAVLLLLLSTPLMVPARALGLRRPRLVQPALAVPMAVMVAAALAGWLTARLTLPEGATVDHGLALPILRTTVLVGITEEWVYRGLALAFLARRFGLRRGAYLALVLFGLLHLLNIAGGVPLAGAAVQFLNTMIVGSVLLLGAVGTGSLVLAMAAHGIYDALVIDLGRYVAAGGTRWSSLLVMAPCFLAGLWSLNRIRALQGSAPYPDHAGAPPGP